MPNEVLNGIVLRTTDYRENDRILNILTVERGLTAVTARGGRKPNSKYAAVAQQFVYAEMEVNERAGKLQLSTSQVIESFYPLRESYEKLVSASNAVKAAEYVSRNDIANDGLFLLLYNALTVICYGDNDPKDIELFFFAKLLRMQGLAPALTHCVKCGRDLRAQKEIRFSAPLGGAVCEGCGGSFKKVSALSLEAFRRMMLLDNSEARKVVLPETVRDELSALIYNYAECVLDFTVMK